MLLGLLGIISLVGAAVTMLVFYLISVSDRRRRR
jgi:ABC-type antimicrobial peptide transport system permease subunit